MGWRKSSCFCISRLWSMGTILTPLSTKALRRRNVFICIIYNNGYNTEDWRHHPCTTKCRCCQHTVCPNQWEISSWIFCAQCRRIYKGPGCFENHQHAGVPGGKSVCHLYTKCQDSGKVVDVSQQKSRETQVWGIPFHGTRQKEK